VLTRRRESRASVLVDGGLLTIPAGLLVDGGLLTIPAFAVAGIDPVILATGNDWRAIEAGAHAYAARDGQYRPLASWKVCAADRTLRGHIELPMQVSPLLFFAGDAVLSPRAPPARAGR
jgi:hypothetical protein